MKVPSERPHWVFAATNVGSCILDADSGKLERVWELPVPRHVDRHSVLLTAHTPDASLFALALWGYDKPRVCTQTTLSSEAPRELDSGVRRLGLLALAFSTDGSCLVAAAQSEDQQLRFLSLRRNVFIRPF